MAVSERIIQVFEDAYFMITHYLDNTIELMFDLTGSTTGKKLTLKSSHTDDRTLSFPDKDGTLDTVESLRTVLSSNVMDYSTAEIVQRTLSNNETLTIANPVVGKVVMLELIPNGFDFLFPPTCRVITGRIKSDTTNYIYFHCISDSVTPNYVVTIGQQTA